MPNALAYLMLLAWPLLALVLFRALPARQAVIWSILGAYMILPPIARFDLPAVPDLDKVSIPNLCALAFAVIVLGERLRLMPANPLGRVLMAMFVASPFATALTNPDPIPVVAGDVPALRLYDSIAYVATQLIALIPFLLGRHFLATPDGFRALVQALVAAGLAYSLPMLVEVRLSPQINVWVYGFFQHDFGQMIRGGGFRPIVFMPHGLWVAFFALMAAMAALVTFRHARPEDRPRALLIVLYLLALLWLCRSAGPRVYALGLIPVILFLGLRWQVLLAAGLAAIVITYPLLRGAHLVPLDAILDLARSYSEARHQSLEFRIVNEEQLLDRAMQKPWFGWGGYGRNLILDPLTGRILSVPDGKWIILLGTFGWLGYAAEFGLLTLPLFLMAREAILQRSAAFSPWVCAILLIYAANLVDLLPNATLIPFTWLMAGAILGHAEQMAADRRTAARAAWRATLPQTRPRSVL